MFNFDIFHNTLPYKLEAAYTDSLISSFEFNG